MKVQQRFEQEQQDLNPRQRFTVTTAVQNVPAKQTTYVAVPLPSSRFMGVSVSVTGVTADQQFVVTFWGDKMANQKMQFKRRFTDKSLADTVQGWSYRDFENSKTLYIEITNESTSALAIRVITEGEAF